MNIFERLYRYILKLTKPRASRYRWVRRLPLKKLAINTSIRINFNPGELVPKKKIKLTLNSHKANLVYMKRKKEWIWLNHEHLPPPPPPTPMWHSAARSEAQYVSRLEGVRCEFITLVVVGTEENGIRAHLSVTIPCFLGARWLRVPTGLEGVQYKTLADAASCTPFIVLYHICTCVCIA